MTTGKTVALTRRIFVGKVMSLLLNMLSRLVITFHQSVALNISANLEDTAMVIVLEKFNPHPNSQEGQCYRMFKTLNIALISHASKVMLKILHARLQHYANQELPDVQSVFKKAEEPKIKLPTFTGS